MTNFAIEAEALTKRFGRTQALAGVDLAVRAGTVLGVLDAVLANRLEHAHAPAVPDPLQQRLVDQRREQGRDVGRRDAFVRADRFRALDDDAGREDRDALDQQALGLGEQLPAPLHDRAQRAVTGQCGAAAAGEQPEPIGEPCLDDLHLAELDVCADPVDDGCGPQLAQACGGRVEPGSGIGERRAAPQRERLAKDPRRDRRIAVPERSPAVRRQRVEAGRVDVLRSDRQPITRSRLLDRGGLVERAPQPRDEGLQRVHLVRGRALAPDGSNQGRRGDGPAGVESESHEHGPQARPGDLDGIPAVVANLERTEDPHLHAPTVPRGTISSCAAKPFASGPAAAPMCTT
jgi:hypothetical protein